MIGLLRWLLLSIHRRYPPQQRGSALLLLMRLLLLLMMWVGRGLRGGLLRDHQGSILRYCNWMLIQLQGRRRRCVKQRRTTNSRRVITPTRVIAAAVVVIVDSVVTAAVTVGGGVFKARLLVVLRQYVSIGQLKRRNRWRRRRWLQYAASAVLR